MILKLTGAWNALATKDLPAEPGPDFNFEALGYKTSRGVRQDPRAMCVPSAR